MVILRPFEDDRATLEAVLAPRIAKIALAKMAADDAGLDDRAIKQIAGKHQEAGFLAQWPFKRANHVRIGSAHLSAILADGPAIHSKAIRVYQSGANQFAEHRGHTACAVKSFAEPLACGHAVHEQRHIVSMRLPVLDIVRHAHVL